MYLKLSFGQGSLGISILLERTIDRLNVETKEFKAVPTSISTMLKECSKC